MERKKRTGNKRRLFARCLFVLTFAVIAFLALHLLEAQLPERTVIDNDIGVLDVQLASVEALPREAGSAEPPVATGWPDDDACHAEEHAEYAAEDVVLWGSNNILPDAGSCCHACRTTPGCNIWVYCGHPGGCTADRLTGECWLKHSSGLYPPKPAGTRSAAVRWTSGAIFSAEEAAAAAAAAAAVEADAAERRQRLRDDPSQTLVFLDVDIQGRRAGRMEFVLYTEVAPRAAENFRALCTGEKGVAPPGHEGAGKPYHFKGAPFYRIIDNFIDQSGAPTDSVYGGYFKDDPGGLALKHDRGGLLSMANIGPDTNGAHFSIVVAPAPHLNGLYTIFGELVSGWDVALAINALSVGKPDNTAGPEAGAVIVDSGQL